MSALRVPRGACEARIPRSNKRESTRCSPAAPMRVLSVAIVKLSLDCFVVGNRERLTNSCQRLLINSGVDRRLYIVDGFYSLDSVFSAMFTTAIFNSIINLV
jgi:hypothetical protein